MATQYMFSSNMNYARQPTSHSNVHHYGGNGFKNGGFAFRKRFERVDWRKMASVDVEQISRTLDFNALQENIMNITFCNIESELDVRTVDPNFVKLFKLAQLTIEYLLYSQEYLAGLCTSLEEKVKATIEDQNKIKEDLETTKKELTEVKRESHKRKRLLIAQQQLMHAGAGSYNKCPFCPKAFLNNSFLQAHMTRRHGSGLGSVVSSGVGSGEPSKTISPDHDVGDRLANKLQIEAEVSQIKERLRATEAQLEEERRLLTSLRRKDDQILPMVQDRVEAAKEEQASIHKRDMEEVREVFMRELKEVNEKYKASELALAELERRYGVKRSYLGTSLQDDIDNEKDLLQQQRAEVAELHEQLQKQMNDVNNRVQETLDAQERRRLRRKDREKKSHQKEHLTYLENEVLAFEAREVEVEHHHPETAKTEFKQRAISMYPSDDEEESFVRGSGTSSLRTPRTPLANSTLGSSLGFTGTDSLNLNTAQFLEQLRENPSMGILRDQHRELLAEKLEMYGIPPGTPGITDQVLNNKQAMLRKQRQTNIQKYPNFVQLRERYNQEAQEQARKQYHKTQGINHNPRALPGKSPRLPPTHQASAVTIDRFRAQMPGGSNHTTLLSGKSNSPNPHLQYTPKTQLQLHPHPQPRTGSTNKTPQSTGSTTEWTSTQHDSDDDSEENDVNISGIEHFTPPINVRLIQSGPRPTPSPRSSPQHQSKPIKIHSLPLQDDNYNEAEDIEDIMASDGEDNRQTKVQIAARPSTAVPQPRGQNVRNLSRIVGKQLEQRGQNKPVGGVDTVSSAGTKRDQAVLEDFDEDSDSDYMKEPVRQTARGGSKTAQGSTDLSTNTYGTSQWGSSSKGVSTSKPDAKRSTSRSSMVSVTDFSSEEDNF